MPEKIDLKKTLPGYTARAGRYQILDLAERQYLMIDGQGDPNTAAEYSEAIAALYPVAYALKFTSKRELARDYVVPPLEGLWWAENMAVFTSERDASKWQWTLILMVPEWIGLETYESALASVRHKSTPSRLADVRIDALSEGLCVQTLHVGPFEEEAKTLEPMHDEFMPSQGLSRSGKHHEIYLSDHRRTPSDHWRTILRQPVVSSTRADHV